MPHPAADTLTAAATALRDITSAATPGPWQVAKEIDGVYAGRNTVVRAGGRRVVTVDQTRPHHDGGHAEPNVALIATLHPGVADLIADLLDDIAHTLPTLPDARLIPWQRHAVDLAECVLAATSVRDGQR